MRIWLSSTLLTVTAVIAAGASPCPSIGHTTYEFNDNQPYVTAGGGCNTLVTVAAGGGITISIVNANPYDGSEDTLVGVVNNSSTPLTSLTLTAAGISSWDSDGICVYAAGGAAGDTWTSGNSSYCTAAQLAGTSTPTDYYGPTTTFSNYASGNSVTVTFTTPVPANGGTTFFSVEQSPSASLVVTQPGLPSTPAPSSIWLIAIGLCALGSFYFYRTRVLRS